MPELAYLNGEILPIDEACIPIHDRGYNFGDAVYEFIASYDGRLFCMEEHLDRLERSMQALGFQPVSKDSIREAVETIFSKTEIERAAVYIQVSRGVAPRDHAWPEGLTPQVLMTARHIHEKPPEYREHGAAAITVTDLRWGRCDIKTVQLLPNVMAKQQALDAGVFDAIFISEDGVVREATSSNVFLVRNGALSTYPLDRHILPGITREVILGICKELGLPAEERRHSIEDLFDADEVFLSGTTTEVLPIVTVDRHPIGNGAVGPVARQLYRALLDWIRERS